MTRPVESHILISNISCFGDGRVVSSDDNNGIIDISSVSVSVKKDHGCSEIGVQFRDEILRVQRDEDDRLIFTGLQIERSGALSFKAGAIRNGVRLHWFNAFGWCDGW